MNKMAHPYDLLHSGPSSLTILITNIMARRGHKGPRQSLKEVTEPAPGVDVPVISPSYKNHKWALEIYSKSREHK